MVVLVAVMVEVSSNHWPLSLINSDPAEKLLYDSERDQNAGN